MCEEDSEDHEAVAKLFEINDSIHRTIERYKLFKKGDIEGANQIPQGTLGRSGAGVSQGPNNSLNLIDFGDPEPVPAAGQASGATQQQQPASTGHALEDDLLGLSLGGDSYGQSGSISLGGSNGSGRYLSCVPLPCTNHLYSSWVIRNACSSSTSTTEEDIRSANQRFVRVHEYPNPAPNIVTTAIHFRTIIDTTSSLTRSIRCSDLDASPGISIPVSAVRQAAGCAPRDSRFVRRCCSCANFQLGTKQYERRE
jgi:hypothetical protein